MLSKNKAMCKAVMQIPCSLAGQCKWVSDFVSEAAQSIGGFK